jgi:2-polyprenyl-3-methyl-5-hydroxy-6-metoxy-1,4-benzoquinol methylase
MSSSCCTIIDGTFGEKDARDDLKAYHKHGPPDETRQILAAIRSLGLGDATLLDIGGGVGVIHHELLVDTCRQATHVDASSAYLQEAREEAARLGHADRAKFVHADFTDVASGLPDADFVTLDRVVCCYPDFRRLLQAAAGHTRRALAMAYPRETWYLRIGGRAINLWQALRRDPFRIFIHPIHEMTALLQDAGLRRVFLKRLSVWEVALYTRETS